MSLNPGGLSATPSYRALRPDDERLALRITQAAVVFFSVGYGAYFIWFEVWSSAWRMLSALGVALAAEWYARRSGRFRQANDALCASLFVTFAVAATMQAGVFSPALPWLATLATIPLLMGSIALGMTLSAALLCLVVALWVHGPTSWFGPSQLAGPPATQMALAWVASGALLIPFIALLQTRLKRNHRALRRQANQLLALNEAKTRFLSSVSHEIRTPLNGLIGTASLLSKGALSKDQARKLLQAQEQSALAMMALVNSLLDFSKLEAHELHLSKGPILVSSLLDEVTAMFAGQAILKRIALTSSWQLDAPSLLEGDRMRLLQVLSNLVSNAVKFTDAGQVHIDFGWADAQRTTVQFRVADNGIGMTAEQVSRLFVPYGQADETISQTYGGTGLGLVLSRELVTLMSGTIEVESVKDRGSVFRVVLPGAGASLPTVRPASSKTAVLLTGNSRLTDHIHCRLAELGVQLVATDQWSTAQTVAASCGLFIDSCEPCTPSSEQLGALKAERLRAVIVAAPDHRPPPHLRHLDAISKPVSRTDLSTQLARWEAPSRAPKSVPDSRSLPSVLGDLDLAPAATNEPQAAPGHSPLVLVVEDNYINQVVARATLERHHVRVVIAGDGPAAIDLFVKHRPEFVLMDLRMPGMSGLDATRAIRRLEAEARWTATPIIAASANLAATDWPSCQAAGMNGFLGKPYTPDQLVTAVKRHLVLEPG